MLVLTGVDEVAIRRPIPTRRELSWAMPSRREPAQKQTLMLSVSRAPDSPWVFMLYVSQSGKNEFTAWNASLSAAGKARRNAALKFLRVQPEQRWARPYASFIGHHGYVIRFKDETGFQHRLFGFFDPTHHSFVISVIGFEQNDVYHPKDYVKRTTERRVDVLADYGQRTVDCPWPVS